jgi:hypothetical protein
MEIDNSSHRCPGESRDPFLRNLKLLKQSHRLANNNDGSCCGTMDPGLCRGSE